MENKPEKRDLFEQPTSTYKAIAQIPGVFKAGGGGLHFCGKL